MLAQRVLRRKRKLGLKRAWYSRASMFKHVLSEFWQRVPARLRRWVVRTTNAQFTVTAGAIIFNEKGQVLLLKHFFRAGSGWGLPGGFLKPGEQPLDALRRELDEEIGLEIREAEIFWVRSFKQPRQIEVLYCAKADGLAEPQSMEVERSAWFSPDQLPAGLPQDQKLLVERAVEKRRL
jgi:8-oxo-dGTP diphosphatase